MTGWIAQTLFATTLLMLLVLAIREPVARAFGPRIAYLLWLLPALRMVLPPLPAEFAPATMAAIPALTQAEIAALIAMAPPAAEAAPAIDWALWLAGIWLTGALLHFGWHLLSYRRFVRNVLDNATQLPWLDHGGIEVCASKAVRSPFATGVFIKTIVLPYDYRNRYSREELRLALSHEMVHHLRCDMSANLIALLMLSLHWFNPIAWRAHRAFRIDQELACDAIVLANASPAERHAYGRALIKSACDRLPVAACALGAGDLKRRLRMMGMKQRSPAQVRMGGALAAVLVSGGLAFTASGGLAAETTMEAAEQVQTVVAAKVEKAVAAAPKPIQVALAPVTPAAPQAPTAPLPMLALAAHPHPEVELPEPPEAPEPPEMPELEAAMEAREAAMEAAVEARAEAMAKAHEKAWKSARVRIDPGQFRALRAQALAVAPKVIRQECRTADQPVITRHEKADGKKRQLLIVCTNFKPIDVGEKVKIEIDALEEAREEIAAMGEDSMPADSRRHALAAIDRRLAELRRFR